MKLTNAHRVFASFLVLFSPLLVSAGSPQLLTVPNPVQPPPAGGSGDSVSPILSADGRYVLFASSANNLVSLTTNGILPVIPQPLNVFLRDRKNQTTTLVSINFSGTGGGNDDSLPVAISTNGRYALFVTSASNIVPDDTNGAPDVLVRDCLMSTTILVSVATNGGVGNYASQSPAMTPEGRFVAFLSGANNLVQGDTNNGPDVFVRDIQSGATVLASPGAVWPWPRQTSPVPAETPPEITPDGRYVVFHSTATNIVSGGVTMNDIYVNDMILGTVVQASSGARTAAGSVFGTTNISVFNYSISSNGQFIAYEAAPNSGLTGMVLRYDLRTGLTDIVNTNVAAADTGDNPSLDMTPDGRFIAFVANTNGVVATNTCILVWDALSGETALASGNSTNGITDGSACDWPVLSPDGRFVAFISNAGNMVTNPSAGGFQLYVRDMQSETTALVNANTNGTGAVLATMPFPSMSDDARFVTFESADASMGANAGSRLVDVFVRDLSVETAELISSRDPGLASVAADGPSSIGGQSASADGRYVVFASDASNLVPNDTNGFRDIFVRDLISGTTELVSVSTNGISAGDGFSGTPSITSDGRYVVFSSTADNLVVNDTNRAEDVFIRDLQAGVTTLVTVNTNGTGPGNSDSYSPTISTNGRFCVFRSTGMNLASGSYSGVAENLFWRDLQLNKTMALTTSGMASSAMTPDGHFIAFSTSTFSHTYVWDSIMQEVVQNAAASPMAGITPDGGTILWVDNSGLHGFSRSFGTNWLIAPASRFPGSFGLRFSGNGRFLTFAGQSSTAPFMMQIFLCDLQARSNALISQSWNSSGPAAGNSDSPDISADGRYIVYRSSATNLVPNDLNQAPDIFLYDRTAGTTTLISASRFGNQTANNRSTTPVFAGTTGTLVFETWATDLVPPTSFDFSSSLAFLNAASSSQILPFSISILPGGQAPALSWPAASGATYVVQFKNSLDDPAWSDVNGSIAIIEGNAYFQEPAGQSQRFYRVLAY